MMVTESLPPYWREAPLDSMILSSKLAIAGSSLSLIGSTFTICVYLYAALCADSRTQPITRIVNTHNHFQFLFQIFGFVLSVIFFTSGVLRLCWEQDGCKWASYYTCDSMMMISCVLGGAPQVFTEAGFFLILAVSVKFPHLVPLPAKSSVGSTAAIPRWVVLWISGTLLITSVCGVSVMQIPVDPETGTRADPRPLPWCWIPDSSPALKSAQILTFFAWLWVLPFFGIFCFIIASRAIPHKSQAVRTFMRARLAYIVLFIVWWGPSTVSRLGGGATWHWLESIGDNSFSFVNAVIFFVTEIYPRGVTYRQGSQQHLGLGKPFVLNDSVGEGCDQHCSDEAGHKNGADDLRMFGIQAVMAEATEAAAERERRQKESRSDALAASVIGNGVSVIWDDVNQSWFIDTSIARQLIEEEAEGEEEAARRDGVSTTAAAELRKKKDLAERVAASLERINFATDKHWMSWYFAFQCGFSDLIGAVMTGVYLNHITGAIGEDALYLGGKNTDSAGRFSFTRHGWDIVAFCGGVFIAAEVHRRLLGADGAHKTAASRGLLICQSLCFFVAYSAAIVGREDVGTTAWNSTASAWIATYSGVVGMSFMSIFQRVALTGLGLCTFQTGNSTTLATDLSTMVFAPPKDGKQRQALWIKIRNNFLSVGLFFGGSVAGVWMAVRCPVQCFGILFLSNTVGVILFWDSIG